MASFKRLGIEAHFDSPSNQLSYKLFLAKENTFKSPKDMEKYFKRVCIVIADDARKKRGLENLSLDVPENYKQPMHGAVKSLLHRAEEQAEIKKDPYEKDSSMKYTSYVGCSLGAFAGLVIGYDVSSSLSTDIANSMNNYHLLAPITGVVQTGISLIGTAITGLAGAIVGIGASLPVILPYHYLSTPHAKRKKAFEKLESELLEQIHEKKEESQ